MEKIISREVAKLLSKTDFKEYCNRVYFKGEQNDMNIGQGFYKSNEDIEFYAPTQNQLKDWLRQKHNIFVDVFTDQTMEPKFCYKVSKYIDPFEWKNYHNGYSDLFYDYNKCLEEALKVALGFLKIV